MGNGGKDVHLEGKRILNVGKGHSLVRVKVERVLANQKVEPKSLLGRKKG